MQRRSPVAVAVGCLLVAACLLKDTTAPGDRRIALVVRADLSAAAVATVVVVVTAPDITNPLVFNIPVANGVAAGTVTLPAGSARTITMHAYDAGGVETHRGSVTLNVQPGTNPMVALVLTPLVGGVAIDVTLGAYGVTVTPPVDSLPIGVTAALTATIVDAHGAPVSQPVTWATLDPGIAMVASTSDLTALVTATGAGSTRIVATFRGGVGVAAIAVHAVAAFPGAEGYGTTTRAGRGGAVIHVTNLNDDGPGSLRAALTASGPRTVIFDVSGYITLGSSIQIGDLDIRDQDFLTVAGQTAPSPGITVVGAINVRANDVLIQHIRIRPGSAGTTARRDGLSIETAHRVVVDHVSVSWAGNGGKNIATAGAVTDVTVSNCITSEAYHYGMLLSEEDTRVSVIRCLYAHNFDRNPEVKGGGQHTLVNNLIFNPGGSGRPVMGIWTNPVDEPPQEGPNFCSVIGNAAKLGATGSGLAFQFQANLRSGSRCYIDDNAFPGGFLFQPGTGMTQVSAPPFSLPDPLTILPSTQVEAAIVAFAGARPADRDAVDTRIISDVINGTGSSLHNDESEVGGFPPLAQHTRVLVIPSNHAEIRVSGYSVLEEDLLIPLARAVEGHP
jgi:hypothetical protein